MKPELNYRDTKEKERLTWRLYNMLLRNQWVNDDIKEEIFKNCKTDNKEKSTWASLAAQQ